MAMFTRTRSALALLLFSAAWVFPAMAAKPMSIEQLQQVLKDAQSSHRRDLDVSQQLADVEITARLSAATRDQLIGLSPGMATTNTLRALADASVFLDPPASEIPSSPAPDFATQKAILGRTIHYVARTLPMLPNFVATRATDHFSDRRPLACII